MRAKIDYLKGFVAFGVRVVAWSLLPLLNRRKKRRALVIFHRHLLGREPMDT